MMSFNIFNRNKEEAPPIFADLMIELPGGRWFIVDVETPGWLAEMQPALDVAPRVGLVMRGEETPRVWLAANGTAPRYLSRVKGQIGETEHTQTRTAGLISGDTSVWLHRDGVVEVAPEPTFREC